MVEEAEFLTADEVPAFLRIPLSTSYKLGQDGKVPCQKIGRYWRFKKATIDRWLDERFMPHMDADPAQPSVSTEIKA